MPGTEEQLLEQEELELSPESVREYLKNNADFLQHNPELLDYLHIPHATGSAVSLVEKQATVLRERNVEMRRRLNSLTANAKDNDKLYERTRSLLLVLLEADNLAQLDQAFLSAMIKEFKVEHASMILFGTNPNSEGCPRVATAEDAREQIGALLRGGKPVCGALRREELAYLFPRATGLGSAAVTPLLQGDSQLGVIAVGSSDAKRYSSDMGTLFLSHIAEVLVRLIPKLQRETASD